MVVIGLAVLLGSTSLATAKPTKPKPAAKPKPTLRCVTAPKPVKGKKPAKPVKPAKHAKHAKHAAANHAQKKPVKGKKPKPKLRTCPAPTPKQMPKYVPTSVFGELGGQEKTAGSYDWVKFGATLASPSTYQSPTGGGSTSITMLDAPSAARNEFQSGVSYVADKFTAVHSFRDSSVKESIVVPKRLGKKTWSWKLASSNAKKPVLLDNGGVDLRNGLYILPPVVTDAAGKRIAKSPETWTLRADGTLILQINDKGYPLPYIVDPGIAPVAAFTGFTALSGNTYIDPAYSLSRIFINSAQSGSFTVNTAVTDDQTQTSVCFPVFTGPWPQNGGCVPGTTGGSPGNVLATYYSGSTSAGTYPGGAFTTTNNGSACTNSGGPVGPFSRLEDTINSYTNWGSGGSNDTPYTELCPENFSAKWQGRFTAGSTAGNYHFATMADDGIRVLIDGNLVLGDWGDHSTQWKTSCPVNMAANSVHSITVEYYENAVDNRAQVRWRTPAATGDAPPTAAGACRANSATDKYLSISASNTAVWSPNAQTWSNNYANGTLTGTAATNWPVMPKATSAGAPGFFMPANTFSRQYSWTAGASTPGSTVNVDFTDPDGNTAAAPFAVIADGTGPTGGTIAVNAPSTGLTNSTTGITLNWNANGTTDGASGSTSGVVITSGEIWRQEVDFDNSNNTCDAFPSSWTAGNSTSVRTGITTLSSTTGDSTLASGVTTGHCYRWALVFRDNVGNYGSVASGTVRVDTTPPTTVTQTFAPVTGAGFTYISGNTVYINDAPGNSGSFSWDATSSDLASGLASITFPAGVNSLTPNSPFVDTTSPYTRTYNWNAATSSSSTLVAVARDNANNTTNGPALNLVTDTAGPTGGSVTYLNGLVAATSYSVGFNPGTDAGAGVASWQLQRNVTTTTVPGVCDAFGTTWTNIGPVSPSGSTYNDTLSPSSCYMYRIVVTDQVGNSTTFSSPNVLQYDDVPPAAAFYDITSTTGQVYLDTLVNTIWFNPTISAGSFRVRTTATDVSGMDRVTYPTLAATGWTGPAPAAITSPTGGYWVSNTYNFAINAADPVEPNNIVARDVPGNTSNVPLVINRDITAPSGGLAEPPNTLVNTASSTVTLTGASDTQSGVSSWALEQRLAPLTNGTCGAWLGWGAVAGATGSGAPPATYMLATPTSNCYQTRLNTYDRVGNMETGVASTNVLRVDRGNPTVGVSSPADNSNQTGTFLISGTGSEANTALTGVTVTYTGPSSGTACSPGATLTPAGAGAWTWTCSWATGALPDGAYTLTVTGTDSALNTGTATWHFNLDNAPPVASWVSWSENSPNLHADTSAPDRLWYNPLAPAGGSGTATATVSATDAGSGMNRVAFPNLAAAGWGAGANVTTPSGSNYSHGYSFTGGGTIGDPADLQAVAYDNAGANTAVPATPGFRIVPDSAPATGSTLTMPTGLQSTTTFTGTATLGTDAGSGIASWYVNYRFAVLTDGVCGSWDPWNPGTSTSGFNGTGANGSTVVMSGAMDDGPPIDGIPDLDESFCFQTMLYTVDNVGNVETGPASGVLRFDFGDPLATVSVPAAGSGNVAVSGTATDAIVETDPSAYPLSGSGLASMTVSYSGPATGTVCTTSTFTGAWTNRAWNCSWPTGALPDGSYTVTAIATDNAGRTSIAATGTILLDNNAPIASWSSWNTYSNAALHAVGNVAWVNGNLTSGSYQLDAVVAASDAGSGIANVAFPAFGAGWTPSALGNGVYSAPNLYTRAFSFTNPSTIAAVGTQNAVARDNAGNQTNVGFEVRKDVTLPTVGTASVIAGVQNTSSIAVTLASGTETATDSGIRGWTLEYDTATLSNNTCGTFAGSWSTAGGGVGAAPGTYSHNVTALPDGCYRYRLITTDNVGNQSTSVATGARRVDRVNPVVTVTAPAANASLSGTTSVTGTLADAASGAATVSITWDGPSSSTGTVCTNQAVTGASPTWNFTCAGWDTALLPDGIYTLHVTGRDNATNVSSTQDVVVYLDNFPPFLSFHSFTETSPYTYWAGPVGTNTNIWFNPAAPSGTYSFDVNVVSYDAGSGVNRVAFGGAGTGWTPTAAPTNDTTSSSTPVADSYNATYTFDTSNGGLVDPAAITVTSYDTANNPNTTTFDISADNIAPSAASLTYTNGFVPSTTVSIGKATGGDGAGSGVASWRLLRDSGTLSGGTCASWSGYTTVVASGTGASSTAENDTITDGGCFRYRIEVTDNVGNVGTYTAPEIIRTDLTPPTGSIVLAPNANPTAQYLATSTRLFVNTSVSGSFDANVTAGAASGVLDVAFPTIATGFSAAATIPGPGTSFSRTYAWSASASAPTPPQQVTIRSNSLGSLNVPFEVIGDAAAPTGAGTTYASGFTTSTSVSVAFTPGTDGAGSGVASWQLERESGTLAGGSCTWSGTWNPAGAANSAGPHVDALTTANCYRYRVTSTDRVGNTVSSTPGAAVMVDTTAPTGATLTLTAMSNPGAQYLPSGSSIWVNSNGGGSFSATVTATDTESGTGTVTFPALGSGWTLSTAGNVGTYVWTAGPAAPSSPSAVVANGAGLTTSVPFTVQLDGAAPSGATIDQENGFVTDFIVDASYTTGSDSGSGIASWAFERRSAPYTVGTDTCGTWTAWAAYPSAPGHPTSPVTDTSVTQPNCYQYRVLEVDRVGNQQITADGDTAKVIDDIFPPTAFTYTMPTTASLPAITTGGAAPACGAVPTYTSSTPVVDWSNSSDAQSGLAEYRVYVDGAGTATATVTAPTSQWTASSLTDGAHTIGVRAYDNQGNFTDHAAPYPAAFRVDSAAPVATLSSPADLSWTNDTTPTLTWAASDTNCLARVAVYIDNMATPVAVAGGGETSWDPVTPLTNGTHTWRIDAIDGAGNVTGSSTRTIGIDTVNPTAFALTAPTAAQTVRGFVGVSWGASSDAHSGLSAAAAYTVFLDGVPTTILGPGVTTANVTGLTSGAHTIFVRATDAVGNTTDTPTVSITGYPAILPPVLDLPAPAAYLNTVPTLTWHWVSDGGPAPTSYDVFLGSTNVGTTTHPTSSLTIADPGDGNYSWHVDQTDPYTGTVSTTSRSFMLDRTAPTAPSSLSRAVTTVSWSGASVTDPATPVASGVQDIQFQINGSTVATLAAGATSYDYGSLPDGIYSMRIVVTDRAGNTTNSSTLSVTNDSVPPTAFALTPPAALTPGPAITGGGSISACESAATYVTGTPTLAWAASTDATSGLDRYDVLIDGVVVGSTLPGTTTYVVPTALTGGVHTWQVNAYDTFGNVRQSTPAPMTVRVDAAAPTAALGTPAANGYTSDTTPLLTWSAGDDSCLARVQLTIDGAMVDTYGASITNYTVPAPLAEGAHTWSITAIDSAGKTFTTPTRTFNIDTTAPTGVTATSPANAGTLGEGMLTFTWSAGSDAGSGVAAYDLVVDGTTVATGVGTPTFGTVAVHAGAHTWSVRAIDAVGNVATFNFSFTATVVPDVTAPNAFDLLTPSSGASIPVGTALTWQPAWDFNGIAQYRVYVDGNLIGTTSGSSTSFTPSAGSGSPICSVDFNGSMSSTCINNPTFSNGKTTGSTAGALPSPASNSWTQANYPGWQSSGDSIGVGDPVADTGWDYDRAWTAMQYEVDVPASGGDLKFDHRYNTQMVGSNAYDGGAIDIKVDAAGDGFGNDNWQTTCAYGTKAVYGATINCDQEIVEVNGGFDAVLPGPAAANALYYRNVFAGDSMGMKQTQLRFTDFAGKKVQVRFVIGGDPCITGQTAGGCGSRNPRPSIWRIDNLTLANTALSSGSHNWNVVAVDPAGNTRTSSSTWNFILP